MSRLTRLPLLDEEHATVDGEPAFRCVVEAPMGSGVKIKYDPELKVFVLGDELIKGLTYPFDWGFLPSTLGEDGDPLDVMIIHDCPSPTGLVIPAQLIGVLEVEQREHGGKPIRNDRLFAVPVRSHRQDELDHVDQISRRLRDEIERFFMTTAELEQKKLSMLGWKGPKTARALVEAGAQRVRQA